jgi:hypothetical protein
MCGEHTILPSYQETEPKKARRTPAPLAANHESTASKNAKRIARIVDQFTTVRYVSHFWRWCSCLSHHRGRVNSGSFWPRFLGRMAVWCARSPCLRSVSGHRRCPVGERWEVACFTSPRLGTFRDDGSGTSPRDAGLTSPSESHNIELAMKGWLCSSSLSGIMWSCVNVAR